MKVLFATWVLPIVRPPLKDGAVVVDEENHIVAVDTFLEIRRTFPDLPATDLGNAVLLPGLVNAHTHLELSMMRRESRGDQKFPDWAYGTIMQRMTFSPEEIALRCREALDDMLRTGTVAVGDIANHADTSWDPLIQSGLYGVQFHEVTGFPSAMAEPRLKEFQDRIINPKGARMTQSLAPHAPYSVSPQLFRLIGAYCRDNQMRTTLHLAESHDEIEFLKTGTGGFRDLLVKLNRWDATWTAPGTTPVQYLDRLGFLNENTLAVHCVHIDRDDITRLRDRGVSVCTCPRSNKTLDTGGVAPVEAMVKAGLNVCIGTDSLASNDDLNLWNEMAALRIRHPALDPSVIIRMATLNGATALGVGDRIGSIEVGKDAALVCVQANDPVEEPHVFLTSAPDRFAMILRP